MVHDERDASALIDTFQQRPSLEIASTSSSIRACETNQSFEGYIRNSFVSPDKEVALQVWKKFTELISHLDELGFLVRVFLFGIPVSLWNEFYLDCQLVLSHGEAPVLNQSIFSDVFRYYDPSYSLHEPKGSEIPSQYLRCMSMQHWQDFLIKLRGYFQYMRKECSPYLGFIQLLQFHLLPLTPTAKGTLDPERRFLATSMIEYVSALPLVHWSTDSIPLTRSAETFCSRMEDYYSLANQESHKLIVCRESQPLYVVKNRLLPAILPLVNLRSSNGNLVPQGVVYGLSPSQKQNWSFLRLFHFLHDELTQSGPQVLQETDVISQLAHLSVDSARSVWIPQQPWRMRYYSQKSSSYKQHPLFSEYLDSIHQFLATH